MHPFRKFIKQFSHFLLDDCRTTVFFHHFPNFHSGVDQEQYGILGLITTIMFFGIAVAKAGLSDGIIRFYQEYSKDPEKKSEFASTVLSRGLVLSGFTSLAYVLLFLIFKNHLEISKAMLPASSLWLHIFLSSVEYYCFPLLKGQ